MSFVVEDGTGLALANSYITEAEFEAYAEDRGLTIPSGNVEAALVRASAWIDARYGHRFAGARVVSDQGLALPMSGLYDRGGYIIASDAIPTRVKWATAEAAIRELTSPGSLTPDVTPGKVKKRVKVEGIEVEYAVGSAGAASQMPVVGIIDGILSPLLGAPASPYFGTAVRA